MGTPLSFSAIFAKWNKFRDLFAFQGNKTIRLGTCLKGNNLFQGEQTLSLRKPLMRRGNMK